MATDSTNNGKFSDESYFALVEFDLDQHIARTDISHSELFAASRLRDRLRKKYCPSGIKNKDADDAAIDKFLLIQHGIRHSAPISIDPIYLGEMKSFIYSVLERGKAKLDPNHISGETLDVRLMMHHWAQGPGNAAGIEDYTHFCEKLGGDVVTSSNFSYLLLPILADITPGIWGRFIDPNDPARVLEVKGSEGACVPKTPTISRFIGKQPILNMAGQLAAGSWLAKCLAFAGLDISSQQERNRWLAFIGSCSGDLIQALRLCTIDLESASDWERIELIAQLFDFDGSRFFTFLSGIREQYIEIEGHSYEVESFSTMGNGFTFPLMTLVMASAVYAIGRVHYGWKRNYIPWDEVGVFGDDIICRSEMYGPLCELLESMGLVVNKNKSYSTGYFRESCGGDFYNGNDVTPFYVKDLTSIQGKMIALNQLIGWMSAHKLYLWRAFYYLVEAIPTKYRNLVPAWDADYAGIRTTEPMGDYTRARLSFQPKVSHAAPEFKLACALGGYLIPEVKGKVPKTWKGPEKDYRGVGLSEIELELQELLSFDQGRILYLTRECASKYALTRVKSPCMRSSIHMPFGWTEKVFDKIGRYNARFKRIALLNTTEFSPGWSRYSRRTVEIERLAYLASVT